MVTLAFAKAMARLAVADLGASASPWRARAMGPRPGRYFKAGPFVQSRGPGATGAHDLVSGGGPGRAPRTDSAFPPSRPIT